MAHPLIELGRGSAQRAFNRLTKWCGLFAMWQLGNRDPADPEFQAVQDHRAATLILRAEVSALAALLMKKGVFTQDEFLMECAVSASVLSKNHERRFPGAAVNDQGIQVDGEKAKAWLTPWLIGRGLVVPNANGQDKECPSPTSTES